MARLVQTERFDRKAAVTQIRVRVGWRWCKGAQFTRLLMNAYSTIMHHDTKQNGVHEHDSEFGVLQ